MMISKKFILSNKAILLFSVLLIVFRLSLITTGHRFEGDEGRYQNAIDFWGKFFEGHFGQAISHLYNAQARPGFILLSLIPAGLQRIVAHLNILDPSNIHFFDIPSFFNALVTLIKDIFFYRILSLLVSKRSIAIVGTIVYSLLINTNVYIRHLSPYDYSLLIFLIVLFLILREQIIGPLSSRSAALCGALSAFGSLVYPGYYVFTIIMAIFIMASAGFSFRPLAIHTVCFLGVILFCEFISQMVGRSYLLDCLILSSTVTHGSFEEGFLFIFRYLKEVEGIIGLVLLFLFLLYGIFLWPKDLKPSKYLLVAAVFMFSIHAILGIVFFKIVFYGRALHMYFPFLVMGAARTLDLIPQRSWRKIFMIFFIVCSIFSFVPSAYRYSRVSYPREVYLQYLSDIPKSRILWILPDEKVDPSIYTDYLALAVNFLPYFGIPKEPCNPIPPTHMVLVVSRPHPLNFVAYTFEHYKPEERKLVKERKYKMQIYMDPALKNDKSSRD